MFSPGVGSSPPRRSRRSPALEVVIGGVLVRAGLSVSVPPKRSKRSHTFNKQQVEWI